MLITDRPRESGRQVGAFWPNFFQDNWHQLNHGDLRPNGEHYKSYLAQVQQSDVVLLNCPIEYQPLEYFPHVIMQAPREFRELVYLAAETATRTKQAPAIIAVQSVPVGLAFAAFQQVVTTNPKHGVTGVFSVMGLPDRKMAIGSPLERMRREYNRSGESTTFDAIQLAIQDTEKVAREFFQEQGFEVKFYPSEVVEFARLARDARQQIENHKNHATELHLTQLDSMIRHYVLANHYQKMEPKDLDSVIALVSAGYPDEAHPAYQESSVLRLYECFSALQRHQKNRLHEHESIKNDPTPFPAYVSRDGDPKLAESYDQTNEAMATLFSMMANLGLVSQEPKPWMGHKQPS